MHEIDLDNLVNNISEIKKIISPKTKIMAVVKANAYGHGALLTARKLSEIGITDFAVATLEEGIYLRKNNISKEELEKDYDEIINQKVLKDWCTIYDSKFSPSNYDDVKVETQWENW